MSLVAPALLLLKEKNLDALESELSKINESYIFCNKVRESAEQAANNYRVERDSLIKRVGELEKDKRVLLEEGATKSRIVQGALSSLNAQAQDRMREVERLRSELSKLREE